MGRGGEGSPAFRSAVGGDVGLGALRRALGSIRNVAWIWNDHNKYMHMKASDEAKVPNYGERTRVPLERTLGNDVSRAGKIIQ